MEGVLNVGDAPQEPETPARPSSPLPVPNPIRFALASVFLVACLWHMHYDATHADYESWQITVVLGFFVFASLGYDVTEWIRSGRGGS